MRGGDGSRRGRARCSSVKRGTLTAQPREKKTSGQLEIECQFEEGNGGRASVGRGCRPQQASKVAAEGIEVSRGVHP